jgi:hypothetical protein
MKTEIKKQVQYPIIAPSLAADTEMLSILCLVGLILICLPFLFYMSAMSALMGVAPFSVVAGFFFQQLTSPSLAAGARTQLELRAKGLDITDARFSAVMPWDWVTKVEIRQRKISLFPNYVFFAFKDGTDILILWSDVKDTMDSTTLISSVRTWAPQAQILGDAQLAKSESIATYTELWLKEMTASRAEKRLYQDHTLPLGTILKDTYLIERILSGGGQGTAYLAEVLPSSSGTAMPPHLVIKEFIMPDNERGLKKAMDGLVKEAAILRRINNPLIVKIYDFFMEDMRGYLAIDYVDGITLRQLVLQLGPRPDKEVVSLAIFMCEALSYLHELSPPIIHGDVTPDNIMQDKNRTIKLLDFDASQELTRNKTNTVVGKHSYMSPEQFKGFLSQTSDIYALGCTLHFLLTGTDPEPLSESCPAKVNDSVSAELSAIVSKATTLDTDIRYSSINEMRIALEQLS